MVKREKAAEAQDGAVPKEAPKKEKKEKKERRKHLSKSITKHGKRFRSAETKLEIGKPYKVNDAFDLLVQFESAKFDESIDVSFNLGVDPKHADQMVRGAVVLPHGVGKSPKILVLAKGEKATEAQNAGADHVGSDDMIEKIQGGWLEFEKVIATPDMMASLAKVAKILGPKGLMPNLKLGTVTADITKAVKDQKLGKIEYRTEKSGIIHAIIGKKSFGPQKLKENFSTLVSTIVRAKPPTSKGQYLRKITVSATMSPGILLDTYDAVNFSGEGRK